MEEEGDVPDAVDPTIGRRAFLAGGATLLAGGSAGCTQRVRSLTNRRDVQPVSVTVKVPPADDDEFAVRIGRSLVDNLVAVGVEAELALMDPEALFRDVLVNNDFDIYVARYATATDPDYLRPLLHSRFGSTRGWYNPFGFVDLDTDDLLLDQRRLPPSERHRTLLELQRRVVREQPFSVVAVPDRINAVRDDRYGGWRSEPLWSPLAYLSLSQRSDPAPVEDVPPGTVRVAMTDDRLTQNRNPLAVEFRDRGTITELVYDSLGRRYDGEVRPWLASGWTFEVRDEGPVATVELRDDAVWHDGTPMSANDVAFTHQFLTDTSLGTGETPVPSPRYHGRISLVESVSVVDEQTARFEFAPCSPRVAARAFTVPVLPEHVWRRRSKPANIGGVEISEQTTEALVWENPEPVGSGPVEFEEAVSGQSVQFSRFDGHFLHRDGVVPDGFPEPIGEGIAFDDLLLRAVPSDGVGLELLGNGRVDAVISDISPIEVPEVGRSDDLQLVVRSSESFYHVGYNTRRAPLSNTRFRRTVSRLVDKQFFTDEVFGGYASPAASPLAGTYWEASSLAWNGEDPEVSFLGENGELDRERARQQFESIGFNYDEDGSLLEG